MITDYHSAYFAHELTRRHSSQDAEKLGRSIFNAAVDLNPHQIEAALFAFRSTKKEAKQAADLDAKLDRHKHARDLERRRNEKRRQFFEAQDEVDARKEPLLGTVEARLRQLVALKPLFTVRWRVT